MKRKELLSLPVKPWKEDRIYDSILIVPTRRKHDSGYMAIAVVGCIKGVPTEIAGYPDDIEWITPASLELGSGYKYSDLRMDMLYPEGIAQMWGRGKFKVGMSLSSTSIEYIRDAKNS